MIINRIHKIHRKIVKEEGKYPMLIKAPIIILANWIFQGILYMDNSEKLFKIFLDLVFFMLSCLLLMNIQILDLTVLQIFIISILIAHTVNWIFNGQIFVLLKNLHMHKIDLDKFIEYIEKFQVRVLNKKSILAVAIFGSISRNEFKETSDVDMRIIRRSGFINALRACYFVFLERLYALFNKFPLDVCLLDNFDNLSKLRKDEPPIILYDSNNLLKNYYEKQNRKILLWKNLYNIKQKYSEQQPFH